MKVSQSFEHQPIKGFKFGQSIFGKPKAFAHCYFIDGLLIDTAHSNMQKAAVATLTQLPIEQIFITHHHEDHNGNLKPLQAHFNCPTYASPLCVELLKKPPRITIAQKLSWGDRPPNYNITPITKVLKTPNHTFKIIPIPGHAIDQVALLEKNQGWLFSADLYVYHYIKYMMQPESIATQIESIQRVLQYDFDVLLCGHNPQFKGGKQKLQKKLSFLEGFYGQVAHFYRKGYTPNAIMKAMKLKENWYVRILSENTISTLNMIKSVIRDEVAK